MALTPRMQWAFPDEEVNPYYEAARQYALQQDVSAYASREDRNILVLGGGTVSFTALTSTLAWPESIEILSPHVGFLITVEAGSVTLAEGTVAYVDIPRSPTDNVTVQMLTGVRTPSSDNALLFAVRRGNYVYFRTGGRIEDGVPGTIFGGGSGGGGSSDLATVLGNGNTTGGTDIELSVAGDSLVSSASVPLNIEAGADAPLTMSAGASTTGNGGSVAVRAGDTNALNFDGGSLTLAAGTQTTNNGVGGSVTVTAGAGEAGGSVTLQAGDGNGDVGGDVRAIGSLQTGGTTPGRLDIFPDFGSGAQLRLTGAPVRTQGIHNFTRELLINRTGLPSTAANQGAIWVDNGSGALVNNGLYYRRESDGTTVRLDEASSASTYERVLATKSEVDGNTATLVVGGPFPFDASEYTAFSTFKFQAVLSTNDIARIGTVLLYNLTDGEPVTNASLTVTGAGSTTPAKVTGTLTVGVAAGDLKTTEKTYEVRLSNDGTGDASKVTFLGEAILRMEP